MLAEAMRDGLHQPFRLPHLPGAAQLIELAYERGAAGACLSGAGPSVLAICDSPISAHAVEKAWNGAGHAGHGHPPALRYQRRAPPARRPGRGALTAMSLVTLAGVAKSHGAQHLFDGVNLQVAAGRRIAVVGPNGAGKTTLLEIITGEQQPDEGTVTRGTRPGDRLPAAGDRRVARPAGAGRGAGRRRRGDRHRAPDAAHRDRDGRRDRGGRAGRADGRVRPAAASVRGHGRLRAGGGGPAHPGRPGLRRGGHGAQHRRVLRRLDDAHRAGPPAARRTRTCCCSTSRPTTSTWRRSSGCRASWPSTPARCCWSATIATSSTRSSTGWPSCTPAA